MLTVTTVWNTGGTGDIDTSDLVEWPTIWAVRIPQVLKAIYVVYFDQGTGIGHIVILTISDRQIIFFEIGLQMTFDIRRFVEIAKFNDL